MKVLCSILFTFLITSAFGQEVNYTGVVTDSTGSPIPYVNLLVVSENSRKTDFTLTNNKGEFKIALQPDARYQISLLHVNYERRSFILITDQTDQFVRLTMTEIVHELGEVEVVYEIPIQIKEDSIIYSADAFASGQERKLKEVLRKMPGVEVQKDGTVKVMGKKVTLVLVEDKTFFNGTTKLAIDNIPADAVDKIEILDNYQKVKFLKGLESSNTLAMNIKLKEDKKRLLFGDIDAAAGHKNRYQLKPNLFLYNPKFSFNLLADVNNYGKKSLSLEDYLNFQNVGQFLTNSRGFIEGINDLSDYFFEQDYQSYEERFGALNLQRTFNGKTDINSFFMISDSDVSTSNNTLNSFIGDTEGLLTENRDQIRRTQNTFALGKINIDHAASSKQSLNLNTSFRTIQTDANAQTTTVSLLGNNNFTTQSDARSHMLKQSVKYDNKLSRKHTLSLASQFSWSGQLPETKWRSNELIFPIDLPVDDFFQINQSLTNRQIDFSFLLKDYYTLNRLNHLYFSVGSVVATDQFNSTELQVRSNGEQQSLSALGFGNDIDATLIDSHLGVEYKFKKNKFVFKPGFEIHHYLWKSDQPAGQTNRNILRVLPKFNADYRIGKTQSLEFDYAASIGFPKIQQLAASRTLRSFNAIFLGDTDLAELLTHSVSLLYDKYNLIKGSSLSFDIQYNRSDRSISNSIQLEGINAVSTALQISRPQSELNIELNLGKEIKHIKYAYKLNYDHENYFQFVNDEEVKNMSNSLRNTVRLETVFEGPFNFNTSYTNSRRDYQSNFDNKFRSHEITVGFEYSISRSLLWTTDYSYTQYHNVSANARSNFDIANMLLRYNTEDSAWAFELMANNVLNTQFKQENSFSSFFVSDQIVFILPRIVMLRVSYKL